MKTFLKRFLLIGVVLVTSLAIFGAGFVFAQYQDVSARAPESFSTSMMFGRGGHGLLRDYVEQALAEKLGLTEVDVEAALANGTTMYQFALDNGVAEADIQTFLTDVHKLALEKAVAAGAIIQEQANFMLERMAGKWQNGVCDHSGRMTGPGMMNGRGGHGMGGGWQGNSTP